SVDCDFHIHGKYSAATSQKMVFDVISKQALLKGLDVVGTGDALHKIWLEDIGDMRTGDGTFELNGCNFVITAEVEDKRRVHHLLFFPDTTSVEQLKEGLSKYSDDLDMDGRPHIKLLGEEIAELCNECEVMIGPSHAFVPWTSIYKEYDSLKECYGDKRISYLELGLSADTYFADFIEELQDITLLSNSDAHSPWPHRLGREFNRLSVEEINYDEIKKAINREGGRRIELNVGLDPRLGKYHRTSCIKCYTHYDLEEVTKFRWRCPNCGATIKKGVRERIGELASYDKSKHPDHRPKYLRIAPLAEILSQALGVKDLYSAKIQGSWNQLVKKFGSEISVLVDVPIERLEDINEKIAKVISLYREERFKIVEGGGGRYGKIVFDEDEINEKKVIPKKVGQTMLDFF
ncbi:MAG: TIGR00375 family protein, partial [Candidatus Hydrothermarchaeales archaeon]